jgi:signal transduction histidine kinase
VASLFDRILLEDRQGFHRSRADDNALTQTWNWEGRWILPSGKIEWIRAESRQTYLPDGSMLWDGILLNISDRKQVEDRLYQANQSLLEATRQKDEFIANISHEVRTPLNAILGMSEILKEEILGTMNPQQLESLLSIDRSSEQLLSLMNDILDISNISQGKLELEIAPVSVLHLCQSSLAFFQQQASEKQLRLDLDVSPTAGNIAVDEQRLRQVLLELLSNAIKFSTSGGLIGLSVVRQDGEEEDGWIDFTITDTGIGIAPDDLDRLFQPFIQIDRKLNRQYVGAGLGLALAQQLVGLHGGRIRLSSELGYGSRFTVRLPASCLIVDREFVAFDRSIADDINLN